MICFHFLDRKLTIGKMTK